MGLSLTDFLAGKLEKQHESRLKRQLKTGFDNLVDFASNDYLGLARSTELAELIEHEFNSLKGNINGSTGSRLLTGNSDYAVETEKYLAGIFKAEAGLICNSGYTANLAVLSSIPQKGETILYDELAHASIKDGARLSLADRFSFRHNNLDDLESKIRKASGRSFIVVESIYSMEGDRSPLAEICSLARRYGASVILDEAHSTGMFSKGGAGLAVSENLHHDVDIRIYTFGKAMGVHGAFVTGKKEVSEFLVNFSRPFIYTTALSPHSLCSIRSAFRYLESDTSFAVLQNNIQTYLQATQNLPGASANDTAIQNLVIPGNDNVRSASRYLAEKGFDVRPILSPTVPKGKERLRICLHTFNTDAHIQKLSAALREIELPIPCL